MTPPLTMKRGRHNMEQEMDINIPRSLDRAQELQEISSAEMARRLRTSPQNYNYMKNNYNPKISTIQQLASVFDMDLHEFIRLGSERDFR